MTSQAMGRCLVTSLIDCGLSQYQLTASLTCTFMMLFSLENMTRRWNNDEWSRVTASAVWPSLTNKMKTRQNSNHCQSPLMLVSFSFINGLYLMYLKQWAFAKNVESVRRERLAHKKYKVKAAVYRKKFKIPGDVIHRTSNFELLSDTGTLFNLNLQLVLKSQYRKGKRKKRKRMQRGDGSITVEQKSNKWREALMQQYSLVSSY